MNPFDMNFLVPFLLGGGVAWVATAGYHMCRMKEVRRECMETILNLDNQWEERPPRKRISESDNTNETNT